MNTLRSLLGLALIVATIYVVWRVGEPYYANMQFEEAMEDAARSGTVSPQRSEQDIQDEVLRKAKEYNVPVTPEQVQVQRVKDEVQVWGEYTVHVDLPIHPIDLHFQPASKSKKRSM
jgi:hypothetical protein